MGEAINMIMTEDQAITGMFSLQTKMKKQHKNIGVIYNNECFRGPHISYLWCLPPLQ